MITENILPLLPDFFENEQVKEIKKFLSVTNSKDLSAYLEDADKPVFKTKEEIQIDRLHIDFLVTYADSVLPLGDSIQFLLSSAEISKGVGEYEYALSIYDSIAFRCGDSAKFSNIKSNSFLCKADIYRKQAKWDECLFFLKKAKKEFEKRDDLKGSAKCENLLGIIYGERGNIKKAKSHFENSLELSIRTKDKNMSGMLEMNLGIINSILGYFDASYSLLNRALVKFEQFKDIRRIAEIRHNLGMLFLHQNNYNEAIIEFDKSIMNAEKSGNFGLLGLAYLNKSYLYTQMNEFYLASIFADRALEICSGLNDRLSVADIYKIKGIVERNLKNYKLAENYLLTSVRINQELVNPLNEAESMYELGLLFAEQNLKVKSKECLQAAAKYFRSINSKHMINKLQKQILQLS